jgi:hypothetical protein
METTHINQESGPMENDNDDDIIYFFKYRIISFNELLHQSVSKVDYNISKTGYIDISKNKKYISDNIDNIKNRNKILRLLNNIPLSHNFNDFGVLLSKNHKLDVLGLEGLYYKYNDNINIFIYDINNYFYKTIVFKNGYEFLRFSDIILQKYNYDENFEHNNLIMKILKSNLYNYDLLRIIDENSIIIKDRKIIFIDTTLKSKLVESKKRDVYLSDKIGSFDIECYENIDNIFIPFSCK